MKRTTMQKLYLVPLFLWIVIIPLIVKVKFFENPLSNYPWYNSDEYLADFFLYYRAIAIIVIGLLMLLFMGWTLIQSKENTMYRADGVKIFIPITMYLALAILSSLFSEYGYFCTHGMPDQFETIWCLIAYVISLFYFFVVVSRYDAVKSVVLFSFIGTAIVGSICMLQLFKIDIYRLIYAKDGYSFNFENGTVYGPFYNINYVGSYALLFIPLFVSIAIGYKDIKVKILSAIIAVMLLMSMIGAVSSTSEISALAILLFAVLFLLIKNAKKRKKLWIPTISILIVGISFCIVLFPKVVSYVQASDTEKTDLENIFTNDKDVELHYKGQKLFISMEQKGDSVFYYLFDQNEHQIELIPESTSEGYTYYNIADERFSEIILTPVLMQQDSQLYGVMITIDGKNWTFSNQLTDDGTYYYYNDIGKLVKLTRDTVSDDFEPLIHVSSLANGRGYIWNKTMTLLKDYIILGSGADTFTMVFPNGDFVDKYNNGYDNLILSKPHNLYLQIAVQTGLLSLICFLIFYGWYFVSSLRLYYKTKFDSILPVLGFAIMLGTLGYMIAGIANDSTVTVAPLYWALLGTGIGINQKVKNLPDD